MKLFDEETLHENKRFLELLSEKFPGIQTTTAEIINLKAILNLPKGTEHFISDIHGEYLAFDHILRNCSGSIRRKINETLGHILSEEEIRELTTIIYYPSEKLKDLKSKQDLSEEWYEKTMKHLITVCKISASKYSHSKIRKTLPPNYAYIIQELLFKSNINGNRENYYNEIIHSIIETGACDDFIVSICSAIRRLNLDHLHIIGDIYDRGVGPHYVMDTLVRYHSVDVQWGNHDILWIGAAAGCAACVANAVRICMRYGNTSVLEDGYGINLMPLTLFAIRQYRNDPDLRLFMPKISDEIPDIDEELLAWMQKAIAIIQFKLENAIIRRHPEYGMESRMLIDKVNYKTNTVVIDGVEYPLNASYFPTIDPQDPEHLTEEEEKVIDALVNSFLGSEKLQKHINFMLLKGNMYKVYNNNLLLHACVPMDEDLHFSKVSVDGDTLSGRALLDKFDETVRRSYYLDDKKKDIFWFLWCAPHSPLFGKDKMATFERYFIDDKATHKESYLPFYRNINNEAMADIIFKEFGLTEKGHIICGHVPVKAIKGEDPIKAGGKILCIDAGFAKAYQKETGMAGCTLTYNSYGMNLIIHEPFGSLEKAIAEGHDIKSETRLVNTAEKRMLVADTDIGKKLKEQIYFLEMLLSAYMTGELHPNEQ
jgi:fructose-1,6-bisphosphatase-3